MLKPLALRLKPAQELKVELDNLAQSRNINRAEGLSQRQDPELAQCGNWRAAELRRLCKMAKDPPTMGQWRSLYARICRLQGKSTYDVLVDAMTSYFKEQKPYLQCGSGRRLNGPPVIGYVLCLLSVTKGFLGIHGYLSYTASIQLKTKTKNH